MVIKLTTKMELENLNKQWNRSLTATKLAMKEAQWVNQEDAKIVSQIQCCEKLPKIQQYHHLKPSRLKMLL